MSGCSVLAMGSNTFTNNTGFPAYSPAAPIIEWTTLGGWTSGLLHLSVTAVTPGPGQTYPHCLVGLAPVSPATGNWADVYSVSGQPVISNDGGVIPLTAAAPYEYALLVPLNGNAYELVLYGNPGSSVTLAASLTMHD